MKGYTIGADDYITKPFDEDELWCKIVAISKRTDFIAEETEPIVITSYSIHYTKLYDDTKKSLGIVY